MTSDAPLLIETQGPVRWFILNRPMARHAVDGALVSALERAVADVEARADVQVIVLAAEGSPVFCAGGDLDWFASLKAGEGAAMGQRVTAVLDRLWSGPRPVIAAIHGDVYGGGIELATAAHLRIAREGIQFAFRQASMGVVTGFGGTARIAGLVASGTILPYLLSAEPFDAARALALGLVHEVVPEASFEARVTALAQAIARQSPDALKGFLELFRCAQSSARDALAAREAQLFREGFVGPWFRERIGAWAARKEAPDRPGRA